MSKGYVFLSNSTKPTEEQNNSRKPISLTNVSRPCLKAALEMGYEVFFGENRANPEALEVELPVHVYDSHTYRSITAFSDNRIAVQNLSDILENNNIEVIHCNTPVGGLVGRLCGKKYKVKKIIYTAHGFHFFKGAPLINRTVYKLAERIMARWTDVIITMNQEDFEAAQKFKLKKGGRVYKVHGVGIKVDDFRNIVVDRTVKRSELGMKDTDVVCVSAGDLVERKNYGIAIKAIAKAGRENIHYLICGKGPEEEKLKALAESLGVAKQIHFLGFRSDIKELLAAADIFLFTTKQEGLPRSMMEAMASGLPCIASKIRGNTDLLDGTEGGFLCEPTDVASYADKLKLLASDKTLREKMGKNNLITIQNFSTETVETEIRKIYEAELSGGGITLNAYIQTLLDFFPVWAKKRSELGIPLDSFLLISVGELNANKNNAVIISAIEKLHNRNIHYILCGIGEKQTELQEQADKVGLHGNVHFLGFRNDVKELYETADCFVMPSFREGLSRSIMEAMASGLPCVVSKIRGNVDLIENGVGGYLCNPNDAQDFSDALAKLTVDESLRMDMARRNLEAIKQYDVHVVEDEIRNIYEEVFEK